MLELAGRGLTLGALLEFYRRLLSGDCGMDFDPAETITEQVVFDAIIPLSAAPEGSQGCSYSEMMRGDQQIYPTHMVTHLYCIWHQR